MAGSAAGRGNPVADLLLAAATTAPNAPAVRLPDLPGEPVLTYHDLDAQSAAIAHVLASQGVVPGERVALLAGKSATVLLLHLACLRVGAVLLPLNPAYTDAEVDALLADGDPRLVVVDPTRTAVARTRPRLTLAADGSGTLLAKSRAWSEAPFDTVRRAGGDPAAMLYTSGTTGRPKAAVLSHENLVANARTLVGAWGFTEHDVLLHVLPLFHTHGLFVAAHCALASGSELVLRTRFDPDQVVADLGRVTVLMGVPTHYTRLLASPGFDRASTARVRLFTSGSAPMLVETHRAVQQRTGHTVLERYGMTETGMQTSNPLLGERRIGTVGPALPGVGLRVVDELDQVLPPGDVGAVQVRGPNVFDGYWRRPELRVGEFTTDGWFRTGDLGHLDADGYLELVGRSKDLIISGGLNVYPKEVEGVLDDLPGVHESAVVGVPDADFGEAVVAIVAPESGIELDPDQVRGAARERLAGYKVPKRVVVMDALPRNAMGKVEKARLREQIAPAPDDGTQR